MNLYRLYLYLLIVITYTFIENSIEKVLLLSIEFITLIRIDMPMIFINEEKSRN